MVNKKGKQIYIRKAFSLYKSQMFFKDGDYFRIPCDTLNLSFCMNFNAKHDLLQNVS